MRLQNLIPKAIRLQLKLKQRHLRDIQKGNHKRFAKPESQQESFKYSIGLTQKIKKSHLHENKIKNLKIAAANIEKVVIKPNEIFSFWRIIGAPNAKNGFVKGRNIMKGKLQEGYGGGLCQLSGILYHIALIGGLKIIERHNHSFDIYTDETRYTPLGADATVVYGYKDLRMVNCYPFSIVFHFEIRENELKVVLKSDGFIAKQGLTFQKKKFGKITKVYTIDENKKTVASSCYENALTK